MIELHDDSLSISFPDVHPDARCTIDFIRTLRIPDDGREYPLPAGLGSFPLSHIEDFSERIPDVWNKRGGVLMPMYQAEALWLNFCGNYPMAIKVAAGKINAVTGKAWTNALVAGPQDYLVLPDQPWLDGYAVAKGLIRQFVAMPLGDGYSAEEQITGKAEFGGLQIIAYPMKREIYEKTTQIEKFIFPSWLQAPLELCESPSMGLAAGGLMRQEICEDEYGIDAWDRKHSSRCFIHLVNSEAYAVITGQKPPHPPMTRQMYERHGIPWFDYYNEQNALSGSDILAGLDSVSQVADKKGEKLQDNDPVHIGTVKVIKGKSAHTVSEGGQESVGL